MSLSKVALKLGLSEALLRDIIVEDFEYKNLIPTKTKNKWPKIEFEPSPKLIQTAKKIRSALGVSERSIYVTLLKKGAESVIERLSDERP